MLHHNKIQTLLNAGIAGEIDINEEILDSSKNISPPITFPTEAQPDLENLPITMYASEALLIHLAITNSAKFGAWRRSGAIEMK